SRRRHTRFSRDWSSDVCSSDLFHQTRTDVRSLVRNFAGLIAFLLLWELVVRLGVIAEEDVPPASVVLTRIAELFGQEAFLRDVRSEERRVGKECRCRWAAERYK